MKKIVGLLFFSLALVAYAQQFEHQITDPSGKAREHSLDITHMKVEVRFDPAKGLVQGVVQHEFQALRKSVDSVFWDAPGIAIKSAMLIGKAEDEDIEFKISKNGVTTYFKTPLSWDKKYKLEFTYEATPKKGIYFIGWNSPKVTDPKNQTRQQIWTQGQGIDNRHWIPMYDNMNDKFITETVVTFNNEFKVLSNGEKVSEKKNKDGTITWHYLMPHTHAGYLLMLAIDRYAVKETVTKNGTPIQFWYYPEHPEKVESTSMYTERIIEFLEDETGFAYPWGSYSQVMVQDFMYGAMENTSATVFGDFFNVDSNGFNDRNYISVNAHEATHQWFGDLITARSNKGTWLQESYATYYAKLFMKSVYGEDEYAMTMRNEVNSALAAGKKDKIPVVHSGSGSARVYPKGSTIIHMLRYVLGDEEYKRVINHYLKKHAFGNVETNDLDQAIQDVLGKNLGWFFDQWLYRGGEPHYNVSYQDYGGQVVMTVNQIQQQDLTIGLFKMPIKCGVYYTDGSKSEVTHMVKAQSEQIAFDHDIGKKVAYVLFDVNSDILKQVTFEKSADVLLNQLANARNMIDRYDAVLALSNVDIEVKRDGLQAAFEKETFRTIKGEIVKQLLKDSKSNFFLISRLPKEDVRVKRVVLNDCKNVKVFKSVFEAGLTDKSYVNKAKALTCLCEDKGENRDAYFERTMSDIGLGHNVRITWLSYKLDQLKTDSAEQMRVKTSNYNKYLNELTGYSSNLYEFRTRMNAMAFIKKFNYLNANAIVNILEACTSNNRRLAGPAIATLNWYNAQLAMKNAIQSVYNQYPFSEEQQTRLKSAGVIE
ncbi:MAG: aminopeptidase N [Bacteroidia bacterium]|jgi:aminopeptidase N